MIVLCDIFTPIFKTIMVLDYLCDLLRFYYILLTEENLLQALHSYIKSPVNIT